MSIVKRYNTLQNLEDLDVLVDEFETSRYINLSGFDSKPFPDSLPYGKTAFLIDATPYLKPGIEFQIDIFDSKGFSIYHEPVVLGTADYTEGRSRAISVEVYDDVTPGIATMIIVAELRGLPAGPSIFSTIEEIPDAWRDTYNLRFTKNIQINTAELNSSPVRFYTNPRLTVTEKVYGTLEVSNFGTLATVDLGLVEGEPLNNNEGNITVPISGYCSVDPDKFLTSEDCRSGGGVWIEDDSNEQGIITDPDSDDNKDSEQTLQQTISTVPTINKTPSYSVLKGITDKTFSDFGTKVVSKDSPVDYPYAINIKGAARFATKHINGRVIFEDYEQTLTADELRENYNIVATPTINDYSASIDHLLLGGQGMRTLTPYSFPDLEGNEVILPFQATGTVEYYIPPSSSFDMTNTVSVADITISNMRTFSGEVYEAEIICQSRTQIGDPIVLSRAVLQPPEVMVNVNIPEHGSRIRTGYFGGIDGWKTGAEEIDEYYIVSASSMDGLSDGTGVVSHSFEETDTLFNSVYLSGSLSEPSYSLDSDGEIDSIKPYSVHKQLTFQLRDNYSFELKRNVDYTLSFDAVARRDKLTEQALMLVYISGSNISHAITPIGYPPGAEYPEQIGEGTDYGKRIGYLDMVDNSTELTSSWVDSTRVEQNFAINTTTDAIVQFRIFDGEWNISNISVSPAVATGFSPSYVNFLQLMPDNFLTRPDQYDFMINFYDRNGNKAGDPNNQPAAVLENVTFDGSNFVIVGTDNVLKGNMFLGNKEGDGIDFGGAEAVSVETGESVGGSGYIRSVGYQGFASASDASLGGQYGFMIYSGSVWPDSGDSYAGVGLELVGQSGSLKFRTNPSIFEVQADAFFVGRSGSQFISGSSGNIEISSSAFHLDTVNNSMIISGSITATEGEIGGWTIKDNSLAAGAGNSSMTMSGADQIIKMGSGSSLTKSQLDGVIFGKDTDGVYKFGIGNYSAGEYIYFDGSSVAISSENIDVTASVFSIDVDDFKLDASTLWISSSGAGGYGEIAAGNPRPTSISTGEGFYVDGTGNVLIGDADGARISFDSTNLIMSASKFYLGSAAQFISGSNGNVEISSSNFHLSNAGDVIMSGKITANEGSIGGFNITNDALSSTNFLISGSSTGNNYFISSSNFNVKASGDVTASALALTGGAIGGLTVESGVISVGEILKLKDSGQITGSSVLFTGGKIAAFNLSDDAFYTDSFFISSSAISNDMFISSSNFNVKASGDITGSKVLIEGGKISGSDLEINVPNVTMSGSSVNIQSPKFYLGGSGQFISGSNGLIEISSSKFHLTNAGQVTGSSILLGNKAGGNYLQFVGNTLAVRGDITADSIAVPSAAATPSSSITSDGLLTTVSASIGGWDIDSTTLASKDDKIIIDSANKKLIINDATFGNNGIQLDYNSGTPRAFIGNKTGSYLKFDGSSLNVSSSDFLFGNANTFISGANGNIKISGSNIDVLTPTFYFGDSSNFISGSKGNINIQNTGTTTLSGSAVTIQTPKFYLGESSNFISGSNGNIIIQNTGTTTLSGSAVTIQTPKFYMGESAQYISGSNGNIEISSSGFYLDNAGNTTMQGKVTATSGLIAGWTISGDDLTATNMALRAGDAIEMGSATALNTGDGVWIGNSGYFRAGDADGQRVEFNGTNLILSSSNFYLGSNSQYVSGSNGLLEISSSGFYLDNAGNATMQGTITATTGKIANWIINGSRLEDINDRMRIDASTPALTINNHSFGQSGVQIDYNSAKGRFYVGDGANRHIKFDGTDVDIKTEKLIASGSSIELGAPSFYLGSVGNFISGSLGNLIQALQL